MFALNEFINAYKNEKPEQKFCIKKGRKANSKRTSIVLLPKSICRTSTTAYKIYTHTHMYTVIIENQQKK